MAEEPQEFPTHFQEAPSTPMQRGLPPIQRSPVMERGGLPPLPPLPAPPQAYKSNAVRPPITERASDGVNTHLQEAPIQGIGEAPPLTGHSQNDILPGQHYVEHKCGHLQKVNLWKDADRREKQIAKLEKNALCYSCATGKK